MSWRRRAGYGASAVVVILCALFALLAWRATHGGVDLDLARGHIEAELRSRLPPKAIVTIGAAGLSYRDHGVVLTAKDVRLALPGMATVTVAALSTVTTPSALLGGKFELRSVTASGLDVGVTMPAGGLPAGTGAEIVRAAARGLVQQVNAADELMRGTGLDNVAIQDATVSLLDVAGTSGPVLRVGQANWLPLGGDRSKMWVQVVGDGGKGWAITFERSRDGDGATIATVEVEDIPIGALAPALAETHDGPYLQAAITFQARLLMAKDGSVPSIRGVLSTGAGLISVTGKDQIRLSGAGLTFALGAQGDRLAIPTGDIRTESGRLAFEGAADLSQAGSLTLAARVKSGALPTVAADKPLVLTGGGLLANVQFADGSVQIERMSVTTADGSASAIGQVNLHGPAATGVSLALSISEMPVEAVRALWPPFVVDNVRRWIDANVRSGRIGPATLQVAFPPDHIGARGRDKVIPDYALIGSIPFKAAEFSPLTGFPAVRDAAGNIGFSNATATFAIQSGSALVDGKGELDAAGTTLIVPELGRKRPRGDLHLELAGPAAALAELSNSRPFSVAADHGVRPEALTGGATLALDGNVPLYDGDFKSIEPSFRLALAKFSSAEPIDNRMIGNADLVLEGRPQSFTVKGEGTLDGIDASVDLILGDAAPGQTDVVLSLDEAARKRLGLDFGDVLSGPIKASVKAGDKAAATPGSEVQQVALDLKDARISLPPLGWEKGAGVPATARFVLEKSPTGTRIKDLLLSGKGFLARGELSIGADGKLDLINLTELALRSGDRLSARVTADGDGYATEIRGASLDARGIIRGVGAGLSARQKSGPTIRVSLDVDEVTGENSVVLTDVAGSLVLKNGALETVSLKGRVGGAEGFEWMVGRDGNARTLRLAAGDGGALIRFGGIYTKVLGGNLLLEYSGAVGGAGTGLVTMRDFHLFNERALEPALQSTSDSGNPRDVMRKQASGDMSFTQLRLPFRQDKFVITIDDAALRGPTLGATASGTINVPGGKMAISGTFIPAFGLNNIAGSIPLLGIILGGGRDEGLVGITYKLFGPLASPKLSMNPMSAIAPGIFRKIFEYN